jgi:hypothetical protein
MMMSPEIITQWRKPSVEQIELFQYVGRHEPSTPIAASSWSEAMFYCSSDEWQDVIIEATNLYRIKLLNISKERYNGWNIIVKDVLPRVEELVTRKTKKVIEENNLPKIFIDTVIWDILHLAIGLEYADMQEFSFFVNNGYWYLNGHFPCGWQGDFPEGKLIVY